jgi:ubiquinone/menaquinone biosynthesis C-methylase UbiE
MTKIETAIKFALEGKLELFSANDLAFLNRIFKTDLDLYEERLKSIGFQGKEVVLDAGCGFGQWSLALANINQTVFACDLSESRIQFASHLADNLEYRNLKFQTSRLNKLNYPDNYFDGIFCYGALFLSPWKSTIAEFSRVMKPGGSLYVTANEMGWYVRLWEEEPNKVDSYDPKMVTVKCLQSTLLYDRDENFVEGSNLLIRKSDLMCFLEKYGFSNILVAEEGTIQLTPTQDYTLPFFAGKYKDLPAVYECLSEKS